MRISDGFLGEELQPPACAALPSGQAAYNLVSGDWSALLPVVGTMLARSALIGTGMAIGGEREHLVRNAVCGGLAVETFVLVWAAYKRSNG
jgi:hypothetical protein